jgi:hypothetical protein
MNLTEDIKVMVNSIQRSINNSCIDGFWNTGGVNCKLKQIIIDICCQLSGVPRDYFEDVDFNFYEYGLADRLEGIIQTAVEKYKNDMEFYQLMDLKNKIDVYFPFCQIMIDSNRNKFFKVFLDDIHIANVYPDNVDSFLEKNGKEPVF